MEPEHYHRCPDCGNGVPNDARYCPSCATDQSDWSRQLPLREHENRLSRKIARAHTTERNTRGPNYPGYRWSAFNGRWITEKDLTREVKDGFIVFGGILFVGVVILIIVASIYH